MRTQPLRRWPILHTTDVDHMRDYVTRLFSPHDMEVIGGDRQLDARINSRRLRDTSLAAMTYGREVNLTSDDPRSFYLLLFSLSGTADIRVADSRIQLSADTGALISPSESVHIRASADCTALALRIEQRAMEATLTGILGARLSGDLRFASKVDTTAGVGRTLLAAVENAVSELDTAESEFERALTTWEQYVMTTLLVSQRHTYRHALNLQPKHVATSTALNVAIGLIEAQPQDEHQFPDVTRLSRASSPRALQGAFRAELGETFKTRLHDVRLRRMHDALRSQPRERATVQRIARDWGMTYSGRLAEDYRASYGESPSETLRRYR